MGHWLVPPDYAARDQAMRVRARQGGLLTDRNWQERVLDETWTRLPKLGEWGYAYAKDARNLPVVRIGHAPHYLRFMRSKVQKLGVKILDLRRPVAPARSRWLRVARRGRANPKRSAWALPAACRLEPRSSGRDT